MLLIHLQPVVLLQVQQPDSRTTTHTPRHVQREGSCEEGAGKKLTAGSGLPWLLLRLGLVPTCSIHRLQLLLYFLLQSTQISTPSTPISDCCTMRHLSQTPSSLTAGQRCLPGCCADTCGFQASGATRHCAEAHPCLIRVFWVGHVPQLLLYFRPLHCCLSPLSDLCYSLCGRYHRMTQLAARLGVWLIMQQIQRSMKDPHSSSSSSSNARGFG